ncbi:hypothetical protein U0070_007794 [Myodes glareolus]|uniref:Uncharacterized protein n=1 Tax=Myodes glareolus TaxID=447135 RepID=A0AAW0ILG4_MYOGA
MGMVLQKQHSSQHWPFLGASGWGVFPKGFLYLTLPRLALKWLSGFHTLALRCVPLHPTCFLCF